MLDLCERILVFKAPRDVAKTNDVGTTPMGNIGPGQLLIIALIVLLIFGAGRISEIGKGLGEGIRNFKKGLREDSDDDNPKLNASKGSKTREHGDDA